MTFIKRVFAALLGLLVLAVILGLVVVPARVEDGRNPVFAHAPYPVSPEAQALHDGLLIGDWHADSLLWKRDLTQRGDRGQVDFPRLREGNVALQVFTTVTKSPAGQNYEANSAEAFDNITLLAAVSLWPPRTWNDLTERALYQARKLERFAARDGAVTLIRNRADLDAVLAARAAGEDRLGALLGIEGAHALEGDIANLDRLEAAGFRIIGLHHFFDNALGGSLHGLGTEGLSDFGRTVVAEVEARGMVLDLAHSAPRVVEEVLALTEMPFVISHGGFSGSCPVTRNLPEPLMRQIAARGGVLGMGYWPDVTCGDGSPGNVAAMIADAVAALGAEHVALGSDFDGSVGTAFDTSELAALTQALLDAGLSEAQIALVAGGNMQRLLAARLPD
ncbi:MAG: peptidase M19 [Rhodobacteraceae bacterium]|nr:peptidase M19 [Paracoccaceae bacterium]MBR9822663.1 peptidase M19 [Paracoccaceae bacterium]